MANARELRDMDDDELDRQLSEAKEELFNLRFQHVTGQLDNYARLSQVKKDVARINTVLRHREIEAADAAEAARTSTAAEAAQVVTAAQADTAAEPAQETDNV
jgi:large subunit ribosomal protein L29